MSFIENNSHQWPVKHMCDVLKVSEPGYYKHLLRKQRPYKRQDLLAQIHQIIKEEAENANYGVQRLYLYMKNHNGYAGSERTIYRICRDNNLLIQHTRRKRGTTKADPEAQKAENLLQQNFKADKPNEKWLTDITEIPCSDGKVYLAPIFDCYDGAIVSFKMADHMRAELCAEAFKLACAKEKTGGMIVHSDRGSQYTSQEFRSALENNGAVQSMSGTGRCYDNARMESFFATLKKEKLYQMNTRQMTKEAVRTEIYRYIHYYNLRRIYTTNDGWPPLQYRQMYFERLAVAS